MIQINNNQIRRKFWLMMTVAIFVKTLVFARVQIISTVILL